MSVQDTAARAEPAQVFNPFPGLRSFEPDEDHLFFGREEQIDDLLGRLRRTRFLAVVGTSGSGKSSLVRSGLIPSLYSGFMVQAGSSWRVAILRPGSDPIGNLAAALHQPGVLGRDPELADVNRHLIEATLHRSAHGLAEVVRQARIPEDDNLLVVVDQFEELFRFKHSVQIERSGDHALAFVKLLLEASRDEGVPVYVVLTMRSDFIGNCTEFPGLAEASNQGQYLVPRMTREERRQAIVGPVAVGGADIAPRLVTRLLNDVGDDPDQLPILQHALMRTWAHWEAHQAPDEPLDLRHYEAVGTLSEALSQHAEEAYRELADDRQRRIAEAMFKALTDRGSDARGIRRPTTVAEVSELAGASEEEVVAVVEVFRRPGRTFLMPPAGTPLDSGTVLDISHESLMRIWTRLIDWVDEEARAAQVYLRLSRAAARYQEGSAGLLRDPELQLALNWRQEARPTAAWAERYDVAFERAMLYLDYSKKERDLYLERRERERRRQLRRARWLAVILGSAAAAMLGLGVVAFERQIQAEQSAAEAQRNAHQAEVSAREAQLQRGIADRERLRAQEKESEARENARRALDNADQAARNAERARRSETAARSNEVRARQAAELARHNEQMAVEAGESALAAQETALEQKTRADRLAQLQLARALALQTIHMQQAGRHQLAALLAVEAYRLNERHGGRSDDADIYTALRQSLARLDPDRQTVVRGAADAVRSLALAADSHTLATACDDGRVRLVDLRSPSAAPRILGAFEAPVRAVAFAPEGLRLAAGTFDGAVWLWDLERPGAPPRSLPFAGAGVVALSFGPGGRLLAAGGSNGAVGVLDLGAAEASPQVLPAGGGERVLDVAFAPDGRRLAAASDGGGVLLWDLKRPSAAPATLAAGRRIRSVAFDPAGTTLAAGTDDGPILLLDPAAPGRAPRAELLGHASGVTELAFAAGRPLLASAGLDGTVRLWSHRVPEQEAIRLADHRSWVWTLTLTPDGRHVISGGADRIVRISWTRARPLAEEVCQKVSRNMSREEWQEHLPADLEYEPTCPDLKETGP